MVFISYDYTKKLTVILQNIEVDDLRARVITYRCFTRCRLLVLSCVYENLSYGL